MVTLSSILKKLSYKDINSIAKVIDYIINDINDLYIDTNIDIIYNYINCYNDDYDIIYLNYLKNEFLKLKSNIIFKSKNREYKLNKLINK